MQFPPKRRWPFLLLAVCLLVAGFIPALHISPQARAATGSQPATIRGKVIDWGHPMRVERVLLRSGRESSRSPNTVPLFSPPKTGLVVQANFPSNCYNNTAYYVIVNGQTSWSSSFSNLQATVWYMWCPTYTGDSIGINWSQGHASMLSGCGHISVGSGLGAFIANSAGSTFDGEQRTTYATCAGGYVWDDSLTVNGSGKYYIAMEAFDPDTGKDAVAQSPCCY